jgi:hypothetical protein
MEDKQIKIADTRLQVTVPEEVADRIRVAAAIEGKSQGPVTWRRVSAIWFCATVFTVSTRYAM